MSYLTNDIEDPRIIDILANGGVGFMPSDTIYGLSCRALDEQAVERIYRLKRRNSDKPLIVLIATISQLQQLNIDSKQTEPMKSFWPGPISLECDVSDAPTWLNRGKKHEAIRIPKNKALTKLISRVGPIISTSANLQGQDPISNVSDARNIFGEQLDFYVDADDLSNHEPSTLVRAVDGKLEVIRPGAVKIKDFTRQNFSS